jgi:hypothetical protein
MSGETFTLFSKTVLVEKISSSFLIYPFYNNSLIAEEGNTCLTFEVKRSKKNNYESIKNL